MLFSDYNRTKLKYNETQKTQIFGNYKTHI